jgi:hypothetical protein
MIGIVSDVGFAFILTPIHRHPFRFKDLDKSPLIPLPLSAHAERKSKIKKTIAKHGVLIKIAEILLNFPIVIKLIDYHSRNSMGAYFTICKSLQAIALRRNQM